MPRRQLGVLRDNLLANNLFVFVGARFILFEQDSRIREVTPAFVRGSNVILALLAGAGLSVLRFGFRLFRRFLCRLVAQQDADVVSLAVIGERDLVPRL